MKKKRFTEEQTVKAKMNDSRWSSALTDLPENNERCL
jgi:hypothetical protein